MEIFFYFFLVVLAVISNFFHIYRFSFSSFFIFFTPCIFIYSFAVRSFGFDVDIEDYASAMAYNSLSLYYLKEPVVWFTQRFLFYYLNFHYLKNYYLYLPLAEARVVDRV